MWDGTYAMIRHKCSFQNIIWSGVIWTSLPFPSFIGRWSGDHITRFVADTGFTRFARFLVKDPVHLCPFLCDWVNQRNIAHLNPLFHLKAPRLFGIGCSDPSHTLNKYEDQQCH